MLEDKAESRHIFTVSEIAQNIKSVLQGTFGDVWIEGEVSNFNKHVSGHLYFTLKDEAAVLSAAMFARANKEVKFKLENGLKVICFGKISSYAPYSQYQIIVERIEPKGIGALQLALEQLKLKLEKEGLFAPGHKRPIPYLPSRIGVVTSITGAAIKDILKVLDRRFSDINIVIGPAQVQGDGAKEGIARAINDFNIFNQTLPFEEKIEVLIVGRGGGSVEDLWAFNEEMVARAIYNSAIPVISAVGHERDWTISDLVADLRAATPSVAAELVIPRKEDLEEKLTGLAAGLKNSFMGAVSECRNSLEGLSRRLILGMQNSFRLNESELVAAQKKLKLLNPITLLQQHKQRIEDLARQIFVRTQHFMELRYARFGGVAEKLSSLSPLNILSRGYSITFKMPEGSIIKDARAVNTGDIIKTRLHNGDVTSRVGGV
jgi:exodeoxyribonuclease VII large subunit